MRHFTPKNLWLLPAAGIIVMCCVLPIAWVIFAVTPPWIGQITPSLAAPTEFTNALSEFDRDTLTSLLELAQWNTAQRSGAVVALALAPDSTTLRTASAGDHMLRNWSLSDGSLSSEFDISWVGASFTQFSRSGDTIVSEASIWETTTGRLLSCLAACPPGDERPGEKRYIFHPIHEHLILSYDTFDATLRNWAGEDHGDIFLVNSGEFPWGRISLAALDPAGEFLAVAAQEGRIQINSFTWSDSDEELTVNQKVEFEGSSTLTSQPVYDLQFDPTRRWLAQIWGNKLRVWKISYPKPTLYLTADTPGANVLTFDRTGKFLFVGTERSVQVWEVSAKQLLKEYTTSNDVSAILVSPDNRLLIYGDKAGVIHLLGKDG